METEIQYQFFFRNFVHCFVASSPQSTLSGVLLSTRDVELPAFKSIAPSKPLRKRMEKHKKEPHDCHTKQDACKVCRNLSKAIFQCSVYKCRAYDVHH